MFEKFLNLFLTKPLSELEMQVVHSYIEGVLNSNDKQLINGLEMALTGITPYHEGPISREPKMELNAIKEYLEKTPAAGHWVMSFRKNGRI